MLSLHLPDFHHDALFFTEVEDSVSPTLNHVLAGAAMFVEDLHGKLLLCIVHERLEEEVYAL